MAVSNEPAHAVLQEDSDKMGKYIGYVIIILVILFALEWFQIVDVPYFEIPDYTTGKKVMIDSTEKALDQMK